MTINAYPLQWPTGWKRIDAHYRRAARFGRARRQTGLGWESSRPVTLTVCETCASERDLPVAALAEVEKPAQSAPR